jgi:hypothetical protein
MPYKKQGTAKKAGKGASKSKNTKVKPKLYMTRTKKKINYKKK